MDSSVVIRPYEDTDLPSAATALTQVHATDATPSRVSPTRKHGCGRTTYSPPGSPKPTGGSSATWR